jgi:unsaturated chondroitin disaccharide hydrolase
VVVETDRAVFERALTEAIENVKGKVDEYVKVYPYVSSNQEYEKHPNVHWTSGFWVGMVYLCYEHTRDDFFLRHVDDYLTDFETRLDTGHTDTHDLGFLYTLSGVALYKLLGDERARAMAIKAAGKLAERYDERWQYIRAWEKKDMKVDLMIDTMMNLPLLYWAAQETGDKRFYEIALNHAKTTARTLVRKDYSTYHIYETDPKTGEPLSGKTFQGRLDESTWARGQAWALYGYVLTYKYTQDAQFLDLAKGIADYFIANLPPDLIPYWDFSFTADNPDMRDSSAAAIASCGLLELAQVLGDSGSEYHKVGQDLVAALYERHFDRSGNPKAGLITEGVYHRHDGANEFTAWGDYFYLEGLVRVNKEWEAYW